MTDKHKRRDRKRAKRARQKLMRGERSLFTILRLKRKRIRIMTLEDDG